jgi:hypothetical protein
LFFALADPINPFTPTTRTRIWDFSGSRATPYFNLGRDMAGVDLIHVPYRCPYTTNASLG